MLLRNLLLLTIFTALGACAGNATSYDDDTVDMSAEELYTEAHYKLSDGEFESAIKDFETLESRYPYGPYAEQAQLEIAYAYYKYDEPESSILAAERFIKLHPNHARVDYAYYLRGLASYDAELNFIYRFFNQDPTERDPKAARRAFNYFAELVKKYPHSIYVADAVDRMYAIRNGLARYELHVADYYLRRKAYVAAVNRAKYVVENYQQTPAVIEALGTMVNAYQKLGLDDLAQDTLKVLRLNYPDHDITRKAIQQLETS